MVERVAVLSDIHGSLPALEAVLAEPDVVSADRIVLTGDIAAGPQPVETLELLLSLGERVTWVRGNADRELVTYRRDGTCAIPDPVGPWAAEQLTDRHLRLLAGLPVTETFPVCTLGDVLFCHATPRDDEEVVLVDTRLNRWAEVFADVDETTRTIVCGHTHMPFVRLAHRRLVVNPGSVGMPYGQSGAHWALLGPGVQLRRTPYDLDTAAARIVAESDYPDAAAWADYFVYARASDADALRVFGPRDGRDDPPSPR
jgi:predicted phosphodiesterase